MNINVVGEKLLFSIIAGVKIRIMVNSNRLNFNFNFSFNFNKANKGGRSIKCKQ